MISDLSRTQYPTEFHTIQVRDFKDTGAHPSLHGLFTDKAEADRVARDLSLAYPDFLSTEVLSIQFGTVEQVAQAQGFTHIEPATDETYAQIREVVAQHAAGSYSNPTPESLRAEVEGDQALRDQMRAEAEETSRRDWERRGDWRCHHDSPDTDPGVICEVNDFSHAAVVTDHPFTPGPNYPEGRSVLPEQGDDPFTDGGER